MIKFLNNLLPKIKIMRISKLLRINSQFFLDVLIFHLSKLFRAKVDDNLIIFGSTNGKAFMGNPKYIYNYLKQNTNYKLIWFSKSKSLIRELKLNGIKCVYNFSIEAVRLLRKARAVFVSHGYEDILPIKFSPRSVTIQTWHGGDIKIIGNHPYYTKYIYSKWTTLLRAKLRDHQMFDYLLSTSGSERPLEILSSALRFPKERILSFGYPRNDIFFALDLDLIKKLRDKYNISNNFKRIILYAPTYREVFTTKDPFSSDAFIKINHFCKKTNSIFLIKAHINESIIKLESLGNIHILNKDSDTQEILCITDILITDYSSIYHDFLLLNRPVLLYTYDYDEYVSKRGIYYDKLEEIAPGPILYTSDELLDALNNIDEIKKKYEKKSEELRNYFNKYIDGKSTERLLKFLKLIK